MKRNKTIVFPQMKKLIIEKGEKKLEDIRKYNEEVFKIKQTDYLVVDKVANARDVSNVKINFNEQHFLNYYGSVQELVKHFNVIAFGDVVFQALYNYQLGVLYPNHKVTMCLDFAYVGMNTKEKILEYFAECEKYIGDNFVLITIDKDKQFKFHNIVLNDKSHIFNYIDLQSSMVYYDGEIKTNAIGAYCIGSKVNIYNYKKKINSLDYDARLQQAYFAYGVRLIFPNTKVSHIKNVALTTRGGFNINIVDDINVSHDPYNTHVSFDYYMEMRRQGYHFNNITNDDVLNINPNGLFTTTLGRKVEQQTLRDICYLYYYIDIGNNPVTPQPAEYFNKRFYVPFRLIEPEVETLLRLLTKHKVSHFANLDRNTLSIILQKLI